jgi:methionyl-tRNA formyltransferase
MVAVATWLFRKGRSSMKLFLFLGSRRGYAVLKKLLEVKAQIVGILCLVEDPHEEQFHPRVGDIAKEQNIPIFYSSEIKSAEYASIIKKINPDIIFVIGWRYLITREAYSLPPKGALIIHDSLLPTYRGFAPMNWAIVNGETKTGVTLFHIAEGVDCGPIVDQMATDILLTDTAKTVDEKIITLYEKIITRNLSALENGTAKSTAQNEAAATYTCKRTPKDGEINWQTSALQIHNLIRGLTHPFPGAYTTLQGKTVQIWESEIPVAPLKYVGNIPGRILGKRDGKIEVLTGNGIIQLTKLQFSGEDAKHAKDVSISVKDTFGM